MLIEWKQMPVVPRLEVGGQWKVSELQPERKAE